MNLHRHSSTLDSYVFIYQLYTTYSAHISHVYYLGTHLPIACICSRERASEKYIAERFSRSLKENIQRAGQTTAHIDGGSSFHFQFNPKWPGLSTTKRNTHPIRQFTFATFAI